MVEVQANAENAPSFVHRLFAAWVEERRMGLRMLVAALDTLPYLVLLEQ